MPSTHAPLPAAIAIASALAAAGCPGGNGGVGDVCGGNDDCSGKLQCLNSRCVPRCVRAPDCGDGYACNEDGLCEPSTLELGDTCTSEAECAAGLSCQIDGTAVHDDNHVAASCTAENDGRAAFAECSDNADCRNGTCALGHCIDLCKQDRDCATGTACRTIPSKLGNRAVFSGCIPPTGAIRWTEPTRDRISEVLLPVPLGATSAELVMSVDDPRQKVGAINVLSPDGQRIYTPPCVVGAPTCTAETVSELYFANTQRHAPAFGQSVLAIPSGTLPGNALRSGVYRVQVASFLADGSPGTAVPRVKALVRMSSGTLLDLHFFFLDLEDHACLDGLPLNAQVAPSTPQFKEYTAEIHSIFSQVKLTTVPATYEDITNRPELDGLDLARVGELLTLGKYATGINVFFVRSLSPLGLQAYGPNPGPAGFANTPQSGIVISLDTLCYRDWKALARLTAHEIGRYVGLYHNVEAATNDTDRAHWRDQITDTDPLNDAAAAANLMYFSDEDGSEDSANDPMPEISNEQRNVITWSPIMTPAESP